MMRSQNEISDTVLQHAFAPLALCAITLYFSSGPRTYARTHPTLFATSVTRHVCLPHPGLLASGQIESCLVLFPSLLEQSQCGYGAKRLSLTKQLLHWTLSATCMDSLDYDPNVAYDPDIDYSLDLDNCPDIDYCPDITNNSDYYHDYKSLDFHPYCNPTAPDDNISACLLEPFFLPLPPMRRCHSAPSLPLVPPPKLSRTWSGNLRYCCPEQPTSFNILAQPKHLTSCFLSNSSAYNPPPQDSFPCPRWVRRHLTQLGHDLDRDYFPLITIAYHIDPKICTPPAKDVNIIWSRYYKDSDAIPLLFLVSSTLLHFDHFIKFLENHKAHYDPPVVLGLSLLQQFNTAHARSNNNPRSPPTLQHPAPAETLDILLDTDSDSSTGAPFHCPAPSYLIPGPTIPDDSSADFSAPD